MNDDGRPMHNSPHPPSPAEAGQRAALTLHAPGRLHLGFLDPAGTLGRRFGSLGLVIDGFETVVTLSTAGEDRLTADGPDAQAELPRVQAHLQQLRDQTGCTQPLHLHLQRVLPPHAGFGSGTQLALAVGRVFAAWHGLPLATTTLAAWLGRGLRSGVGIAGFDQGGLLLDGGPGAPSRPAPLLARVTLPDAWRVIVVTEPGRSGLSGAAERQALATLAPLTQAQSADICHQVLMRVLPGAADGHFETFAAGLGHVQQVLGEHFAPAQGGLAYTSAAVSHAVQCMAAAAGPDGAATGQSSWGPTGFAIVPSQQQAESLVQTAQAAGALPASLRLHIVRARNHGAVLHQAAAQADIG
jgi:beta-ribofuranosylaminobenzene 5'-phosphate synthase